MIIKTNAIELRATEYKNKMIVTGEDHADIYTSVDEVLTAARKFMNEAFEIFAGLEDEEMKVWYTPEQAERAAQNAEKWFGYAQQVMKNGFYRNFYNVPASLVNTVTGY